MGARPSVKVVRGTELRGVCYLERERGKAGEDINKRRDDAHVQEHSPSGQAQELPQLHVHPGPKRSHQAMISIQSKLSSRMRKHSYP